MTQKEQNEIDVARMMQKRGEALELLDEFKEWHLTNWGQIGVDGQLILLGLRRDILRGTEDEVDRISMRLIEHNNQAFMRKMTSGIEES